jgi:hypothetical protein
MQFTVRARMVHGDCQHKLHGACSHKQQASRPLNELAPGGGKQHARRINVSERCLQRHLTFMLFSPGAKQLAALRMHPGNSSSAREAAFTIFSRTRDLRNPTCLLSVPSLFLAAQPAVMSLSQ